MSGLSAIRRDAWRLEAYPVFGGYRLARVRWVLTIEGWDEEFEFLAPVVWPTADECMESIFARSPD